jgi:protocatechuate 4,5-dioxygenase beta chain
VAKIVAGVGCSHVPAIGAALDLGKTEDPYWQRVFSGFEHSKQWIKDLKPDVAIVVFNDHATAFSVDMIPTLPWVARTNFRPPMKAGARARCQWCAATLNLPHTSLSLSFSMNSI